MAVTADHAPEHIGQSRPDVSRLRAVMCGSFRKDPAGLEQAFRMLCSRFEVLSPLGVEFIDPLAEFVRLRHETDESSTSIESRHLHALSESDFVWLHAPDGYVGSSAMFELGHAHALGVPIFSDTAPADEAFVPWVTIVNSPLDVELRQEQRAPGNGLRGLQRYYERTAERRGWDAESVQDTLLLMTEEMGELARAVRRGLGLSRDHEWGTKEIGEELADLQLYLVHLSSSVGVDLAEAVTSKEGVNAARAAARTTAA